jgi:hypothetical protein
MVRVRHKAVNLLAVGTVTGQETGATREFRRADSWIDGHSITSQNQGIRYFADVSMNATSHRPRTELAR